jgi:hypothetical protein
MTGRLPPKWRSRGCHPRANRHGRWRLALKACRFAFSGGHGRGRRLCDLYVGLIGAAGGAHQSSVIGRLGRPSLGGDLESCSGDGIATAMTPSHGLGQVRPDRLTAIHYPCQTREASLIALHSPRQHIKRATNSLSAHRRSNVSRFAKVAVLIPRNGPGVGVFRTKEVRI